MLRRFVAALPVAVLLASSPAAADPENPNLLPMGERESLVANAGIATASAGSVFYNPANLARIEDAQLSVSGTTLMRFELETDAFISFGDEDVPFDASGFLPIPASLVSTYRLGEWGLGTAILVPNAMRIEDQSPFSTSVANGRLLLKSIKEELWIGGSAARQISERVSVGVSLFGVQSSTSSITMFQITPPDGSTRQNTFDLQSKVVSAVAILGAHAQVTPGVGVGVRAQLPSLRLTSSGSSYQATAVTGPDSSFSEVELEIEPEERVPAEIGAGLRVEATSALALVADLTVRLPTSFVSYEGGPEREYGSALRVAAGAELALSERVTAAAGAGYNESAVEALDGEGEARDDFLVFTGGLGWESGRTTTNVGAFLLFSDGELVPVGAPMERVPTTTRAYGALLGFTYRL